MLKEKLAEELKDAMKTKNVNKKNAVQMVRVAILQVEKDKQVELGDTEILDIISKEVKKRKESLVDFEKAGREDLINQINEEIGYLEEYLPKQLSDEELDQIIKDMGSVMKAAKEKIGASADGKRINDAVKKYLA